MINESSGCERSQRTSKRQVYSLPGTTSSISFEMFSFHNHSMPSTTGTVDERSINNQSILKGRSLRLWWKCSRSFKSSCATKACRSSQSEQVILSLRTWEINPSSISEQCIYSEDLPRPHPFRLESMRTSSRLVQWLFCIPWFLSELTNQIIMICTYLVRWAIQCRPSGYSLVDCIRGSRCRIRFSHSHTRTNSRSMGRLFYTFVLIFCWNPMNVFHIVHNNQINIFHEYLLPSIVKKHITITRSPGLLLNRFHQRWHPRIHDLLGSATRFHFDGQLFFDLYQLP